MDTAPGPAADCVAATARFRSAAAQLQATLQGLATGAGASDPTVLGASAVLVMELKASSRATHVAADRCRQEVLEYKKSLDAQQMELQNLAYRRHHLLRELSLCHDFTIKEVERVEEDEGMVVVATGDDLADPVHHQARLAALTEEIEKRKALEATLAGARAQRDEVEQAIDAARSFLCGLPDHLRAIASAGRPLRDHFARLPGTAAAVAAGGATDEQRRAHDDLSPPLYTLFRMLDALCARANAAAAAGLGGSAAP